MQSGRWPYLCALSDACREGRPIPSAPGHGHAKDIKHWAIKKKSACLPKCQGGYFFKYNITQEASGPEMPVVRLQEHVEQRSDRLTHTLNYQH